MDAKIIAVLLYLALIALALLVCAVYMVHRFLPRPFPRSVEDVAMLIARATLPRPQRPTIEHKGLMITIGIVAIALQMIIVRYLW